MISARLLTPALAGLVLLAAGCGSSNSSSSGSSSSGTKSSSAGGAYGAAASTSTSTAAASSGSATAIKFQADPNGGLSFTKKKLTAKAGTVALVMTNPSSSGLSHGIGVSGNGVDKDGAVVPAGSVSRISVKLKPGTYTYYCPIPSHKQAGMTGTLVVH